MNSVWLLDISAQRIVGLFNHGEYRLIISNREYENCMDIALRYQSQKEDLLPDGFWQRFGPNRRSCDGLVRETTLDPSSSVGDHFFEAGSFSQDIGLKQKAKAPESSIEDAVPMVHQSCSLYDSSMSYCKASVDLIKRSNSPDMEAFWSVDLRSCIHMRTEALQATLKLLGQ